MAEEFDPETLASLREQMGEEFPALLDIFRGESAKHLEEARGGIASGQWERARRAAHSMKSSAALFGLPALSATMRALEHLPDAAPPAEWARLLAEAEAQRGRGLAWIEGH